MSMDYSQCFTDRCPLCHSWNGNGRTCVRVNCLACGSERCHSEGIGRGTCRACSFGMLPGWSGNNNPDQPGRYPLSMPHTSVRCVYAGCGDMAVYRYLPGSRKTCCKTHGDAILAREKIKRDERMARYAR